MVATLIIAAFVIVLAFPISSSDEDSYAECSHFASCGKISHIGYPFWGYGRLEAFILWISDIPNQSGDYPIMILGGDCQARI